MKVSKTNALLFRWGFYLAGLLLLALGLALNTLTGLGTSAIISVAFTLSETLSLNLGDVTLALYCLFIGAQFLLKGKNRRWADLLQLPLSLVFTRFLNLFKGAIPYQSGFLPGDIALLALAILLTGVGAAMSVGMALVPNPADGIVAAIAARSGKGLGFCKNLFDVGCVACSIALGAAFGAPFAGVGLGTLLSMVGVGRVIYFFNRLCGAAMKAAAGLGPKAPLAPGEKA